MGPAEQQGTWQSESYVAQWVGGDRVGNMLELPRHIAAALVQDSGTQVGRVVDLASGPGSFLEVFLDAFPDAAGVWVDSSEPMLARGRENLARFGDRVEFRLGDVEHAGDLDLPPSDVVLTARVVHHFVPESIARLYRMVFDLLGPGGFFFNLDHFGSPPGWEPRYRRIRAALVARRPGGASHPHPVPFSPVVDHLRWLTEAGFEAPDVAWKAFFTALLAGQKA